MKKNVILLLVIVSIFIFGSAFAADRSTAPEASGKLFNGITYFGPVPESICGDTEAAFEKGPAVKLFNGVTAFDLGQSGTGAKGSCACAGRRAKEPMMSNIHNGITFF
jgi:hypothetical protein